MKSQQLEFLKPTLPLPIAGSDSDATDIPEDSGNLNREYGFKAGYFNDDALVTKDDFNGVLKSITSNLAYGNAGGFYEFNPEVAEAIGGYAKGAVLTFMFGGAMHLIRSMHDNNLVNFNEVGANGIDWELVLPNDKININPDINWNAQRAKLIYSLEHGKAIGDLSVGTFDEKGYVVVIDNNVVFGSPERNWWKLILIVGSIDGTNVESLVPNDIFSNPLSNSDHAFPITLIDGYVNGNIKYNITNQVQVQKGTSYKLYGNASRENLISSGSYDIYFLPTPD